MFFVFVFLFLLLFSWFSLGDFKRCFYKPFFNVGKRLTSRLLTLPWFVLFLFIFFGKCSVILAMNCLYTLSLLMLLFHKLK